MFLKEQVLLMLHFCHWCALALLHIGITLRPCLIKQPLTGSFLCFEREQRMLGWSTSWMWEHICRNNTHNTFYFHLAKQVTGINIGIPHINKVIVYAFFILRLVAKPDSDRTEVYILPLGRTSKCLEKYTFYHTIKKSFSID